MMSMDLRRRLQDQTGLALPGTIAFEQGSVAALSGWLLKEMGGTVATPRPTHRLDMPA